MILIRSAPTVTRNGSAAASTWSTVCPGNNPRSATSTRPDPQRSRPRPGTVTPGRPVPSAGPAGQAATVRDHRPPLRHPTADPATPQRGRHPPAERHRPDPAPAGEHQHRQRDQDEQVPPRLPGRHHQPARRTQRRDRVPAHQPAEPGQPEPHLAPIPRTVATSTRPIDRTRADMIKTPEPRPASCRSRPPASTPRSCRAG